MNMQVEKTGRGKNRFFDFPNANNALPFQQIEAFSQALSECICRGEDFCLFASASSGASFSRSYLFRAPRGFISAASTADMGEVFAELEKALSKGYYAAGYLTYEAGKTFCHINSNKSSELPLLNFALFDKPLVLEGCCQGIQVLDIIDKIASSSYNIGSFCDSVDVGEYCANIEKIKEFIASGLTYQVNYTFKHRFSFKGCGFSLFSDLLKKQRVEYAAFIRNGNKDILSVSPEMFFEINNGLIRVKPMKGTWKRGKTSSDDKNMREQLRKSEKNRAENVMIVDLLRNDLGVICEKGGVKTRRLFEVEKYNTVYQMTSTVEGRLKKDISCKDIFKALFPSGSVTGAPKIMTMKLIDRLEPEARGVYTGAAGFLSPDDTAVFNVAIRTVVVNNDMECGEMGIGGGITYVSDPQEEYAECKLKAKFLTEQLSSFSLLETMRYAGGSGYFLKDRHISRLKESAFYFDFLFDEKRLREALDKVSLHFLESVDYKVRVLLDSSGSFSIETEVILPKETAGERYVRISDKSVNPDDIFLFHKTTNREFYNKELQKSRLQGCFDCIFLNDKGFLTEGAISNIFIKRNGLLYTPPVEDGLLKGTYRDYLMDISGGRVIETSLTIEDLRTADRIYMCNSVRGLFPVRLLTD